MANLQVELKLDNFPPVDSSDNRHLINHEGLDNASVIDDVKFNKVYFFNGNLNAVEIPFKKELHINEFTFSLCVKADYEKGKKMIVIENGQPAIERRGYQLFINEEGHWAFKFGSMKKMIKPGSISNIPGVFIPNPPVFLPIADTVIGPKAKPNHWTHIAVTHTNLNDLIFYVDGFGNEGRQPIKAIFNERVSGGLGVVLGKEQSGNNHFKGQMAHFRMFDEALTDQELKFWMNKDVSISNIFKSSLAIDFNLLNKDAQKILAITDDFSANDLEIEILNTTPKVITVQEITGVSVSRANAHFALSFRPGVLSVQDRDIQKISLKETEKNKGWEISSEKQEDGTIAVYLLKTSEGNQEIAPKASLSLKLKGFVADNHYGSRGTQVMLTYQKLLHAGATNPISGTQIAYLNIVSHMGRENIPLHIGFIGSNTIINDGNTENELTLRITNVSQDYTIKGRAHQANTDKNPMLTFDFNSLDDTEDSVLADKFESITIEAQHSDSVSSKPLSPEGNLASSGVWTYAFEENLAPKAFINVSIKGIKTKKPSGIAHLYVKHEDIPGYFDGQTIVPIEKTPMVFRNRKVGIGTTNPSKKLEIDAGGDSNIGLLVNGRIQSKGMGGLWVDGENKKFVGDARNNKIGFYNVGWKLVVRENGNVGIGKTDPSHKLHVEGSLLATGVLKTSQIGIAVPGNTNLSSRLHLAIGDNNSGIKGANGILAILTNDIERLRINQSGNVGIGTGNPSKKLEIDAGGGSNIGLLVNGRIQSKGSGGLWVDGENKKFVGDARNNKIGFYNVGWKLVVSENGNVGIGTTDPSHKLHVEGSLFATGLTVGGITNSDPRAGTNFITIGGGDFGNRAKDLWLRFRNGGSKGGRAGVNFSHFGISNFYIHNENGVLEINHVQTAKDAFTRANDTNVLKIKKNGRVGIALPGSTSPSDNVHLAIGDSDSGLAGSNGVLAIHTNGSEHLRVVSTGNVGIGTVSPKEKLHVNGKVIMNCGHANKHDANRALADQPNGSCYFAGADGEKFWFYFKDSRGSVKSVEIKPT